MTASKSSTKRWWQSRLARLLRSIFTSLIVVRLVSHYARPFQVLGIEKLEGLPGPVILAAHHESHSDTPILLAVLPRQFRDRLFILAAADVLFTNRFTGTLTTLFLGAIPIERESSPLASLRETVEFISEGDSLLIYPLGKCSPDGRLGELKTAGHPLENTRNKPGTTKRVSVSRPSISDSGVTLLIWDNSAADMRSLSMDVRELYDSYKDEALEILQCIYA